MSARRIAARYWPHAFGTVVSLVVAVPAAVASYRHGITVVERSGDVPMAPWLPMTTDGLLIAALVALWVRRVTAREPGRLPWVAFGIGLVMTVATNLAGARLTLATGTTADLIEGIAVAVWPPLVIALVLELVALIVVPDRGRTEPVGNAGQASNGHAPVDLDTIDVLALVGGMAAENGKMPGASHPNP